jgi:hypothetical protein
VVDAKLGSGGQKIALWQEAASPKATYGNLDSVITFLCSMCVASCRTKAMTPCVMDEDVIPKNTTIRGKFAKSLCKEG